MEWCNCRQPLDCSYCSSVSLILRNCMSVCLIPRKNIMIASPSRIWIFWAPVFSTCELEQKAVAALFLYILETRQLLIQEEGEGVTHTHTHTRRGQNKLVLECISRINLATQIYVEKSYLCITLSSGSIEHTLNVGNAHFWRPEGLCCLDYIDYKSQWKFNSHLGNIYYHV